MIPFDEALRIVMGSAVPVGTETVAIGCSLGRALAEDVSSDIDMPPFNKAAMDGYACRRDDLADELTVIETIPAGTPPTKRIGPGQCSKIMTGAMVPEGADCVIMVEFTESPAPDRVRFTGGKTAGNICPVGEDIRTGDLVLSAGSIIGPAEIAVLATVGCVEPVVSRRVRIGVITTGDEIVEPDRRPAPWQIRNSNGYQLVAQAERMGAEVRYYGIAADAEEAIRAVLVEALESSDVVLLSGGVSMGDYDLVPGVMRACGVDLKFEKVAVKPGKPTVFGIAEGAFCFGLPGNPVSTFILFEIMVKPFVCRLMGHDFDPPHIIAPIADTIRMRKTDRMAWMPVKLSEDGRATRLEFHGSAHSGSLCGADGLIAVPVGVKEGTPVRVRQI